MAFFESLRTAVGRFAAGVHELSAPADERTLSAAEKRLSVRLPSGLREFYASFDGALLFHETLRIVPAADLAIVRGGDDSPCLRIGDTQDGALIMRPNSDAIYLVDDESPDPILCGSSIEAWLDATLAREGLLVDREGEFRDVFTEDGLSLTVRRKRVQLGRRHDPQAALYVLEQAEIDAEAGEIDTALATLRLAVSLDPQAGAAWEMLATLYLDRGEREAGEEAALRAADSAWHPPLKAARKTLATRIRTSQSLRVL